ncbi:substrate-binding domain-containing protein [Companilactobacillus farciminis]|uniref:substrate-binding domain-containing protein n=1 Tax=Companilactobacillus farciminis TaxID=1612 RepID=UPI00232DD185|nr:substrate-binding domain-containing protein [Companilactobacillus farciminis]WCG36772.1 substrate-binding domain-containing protein [Companilactobacillus farciminis]
MNLQIPTDIRLVGYDGTNFIQNYHPELTTIMQPITDIVTMMIDLLLKRIDDPDCQLEKKLCFAR